MSARKAETVVKGCLPRCSLFVPRATRNEERESPSATNSLTAVNREQIYRLRAPASGREALAKAKPGHLYVDRETGEEMEPVSRVLPLAPSASALLRTPENLRACRRC